MILSNTIPHRYIFKDVLKNKINPISDFIGLASRINQGIKTCSFTTVSYRWKVQRIAGSLQRFLKYFTINKIYLIHHRSSAQIIPSCMF